MTNVLDLKSPRSEIVQANYNKLSDHIRRLTPQGIQCSVFCGGANCKYETPENWKADSLAIQGIYSHWITDEILAMARPSTVTIVQRNIIQQFESLGIKSIINLQSPKEHASCGQPLEESGFSYDPNIFMEHNIYYYNFAWKDYGDCTLVGLLNIVKVLAFATSEGRVAVHCHAGLGRTGVLISCYLVYSLRVSANDAIRYVRLKRPGSVQTHGQIVCVRHFAQFLLPKSVTFFIRDNLGKDRYMNEFTLHRFLKRQKVTLHGYDERNFKYIPKIIHCICERILKLTACWINEFPMSNTPYTSDFLTAKLHGSLTRYDSTYSICSSTSEGSYLTPEFLLSPTSTPSSPNPSENGDPTDSFSELSTLDGEEMSEELLLENKCFQELETQKNFLQEQLDEEIIPQDISTVISALLMDQKKLPLHIRKKIKQYQNDINASQLGWVKLSLESNLEILTALLFDWLENLKQPVLNREHFEQIVILYKQPDLCFQKFGIEEGYLVEYLLRFLAKIQPVSMAVQDNLLKRLIGALSKQSVNIDDDIVPSDKNFKKIGEGTLACTMTLFRLLFDMVDQHHNQRNLLTNENDEEKLSDQSDVENGFQ